MLIKSYRQRMERQTAKHDQVLIFLRDEAWSSSRILGNLLGVTPASISKTLAQLERLGYVIKHQDALCRYKLWGITAHGLAHAWPPDEIMQVRGHFEPSKLSSLAIPHHLDIQLARLRAERALWKDWTPEQLLPKGLAKRPDAVVITDSGLKVAVELERNIKTLKRYEAIFSAYLRAIKEGEYTEVHYVTPDVKLAKRLRRVLDLVTSIPVLGERVQLTEKHKGRFKVYSLEDWPPK